MELVTLGIFCAALVGAIFTGVPTVCALLVGLAAFCIYAWRWSGSVRRVTRMCWEGIAPIAKILGMLALIGVLTGLWRAAGVIPAIVYYAVPLISPGVFLLATFLLNCLVSVLTGTSFGTAATVGSICISMAGAMGVPLFAAGGAALSGAFFGDRCSPISTSALLVADLTGTDFYNNLKRMVKSAAVPFVLTCVAYFALGLLIPASGEAGDMAASLASAFAVGPVVLLPPVIVFALALMRVDILVVIGAGIASSVPLCLAVQDMTTADVARTAILGDTWLRCRRCGRFPAAGWFQCRCGRRLHHIRVCGHFYRRRCRGTDRVAEDVAAAFSLRGYANDVCVYGDHFLQPDVGDHAGAPAVQRSRPERQRPCP